MLRADAWLTANEAISFERHDHLVDRGRADLKVALHVGLGGWASEHVRVGVDESQVLADESQVLALLSVKP
jgi:hypothetical protein